SASATSPSARVRNLCTYCSRAKGRAPSGWASATAMLSSITVPSVRVMTTEPPKAFSARSREWYRRVHAGASSVVTLCERGEGAELVHVLLAREGAGAQRVGIGHGDAVLDHGPVGEGDDHGAAEDLLREVQGVVPADPLRVLLGGDLVPEGDGVRAARALGGVGVHVVPGAVLQGDGEDVRDRVVEGLPRGCRIVLLRNVRAGADHVVRAVRGADEDRGDPLRIGGLGVLGVQLAG